MAIGKKELWPQDPPESSPTPPTRVPPRVTPVTLALSAVSILVVLAYGPGRPPEWGALWGPAIARGEWWRLATWLVTHGGVLHLVFNLSVVWTVGRGLEVLLGSARFLLVTAVCGLGAALAVLVFSWDARTVGMSGAILGWVGVLLPLLRREGRRQLVTWLVQVAVISLLPGVSWAGHLGGLLAGLPLGLALRRGPTVFARALPVIAFLLAVLLVLVGTGRLR